MEMLGDDEAMLRGQAEIWKLMFAFADSMALKCAIELRIPDIIHSHGGGEPMTLSHIASYIPSSSPSPEDSLSCLARIMRLLVRKDIFSVRTASDGSGEKLYGLTPSSRWLLQETRMSLTPMILMEDHPTLMLPWHCFSKCVKDGGIAFEIAHGRQIWDFASEDPTFNRLFNDGMACTSRIAIDAIVRWYKEGFERIGSLVDVGGGIGGAITEIVKSYPHIKGINFDLPHVIATAPAHPGVSHVGGDMFVAVPKADAVFMKWIMHDWNDQDCVKILKNCRRAIPEEKGKVIIADIVLQPYGSGLFDETGVAFDLLMIAHSSGGKERTEPEWKKLLEEGGFPRYNIIKIPSLLSIIEAYPI